MIYLFALIELAVIIVLLLHISTLNDILKKTEKDLQRFRKAEKSRNERFYL